MNFWEKITGSDMSRAFQAYEARVQELPADYQAAWAQVNSQLWQHASFTGRNLMPLLEGVLGLFEESAADGLALQAVLGDDLQGFCSALAGEAGAKSLRDSWRDQLNQAVAKKLAK